LKSKQIFKEHNLLLVVYSFIFLFLIFQKAIYSPDTYGYLTAMPYRHLGYVIFSKAFLFIFGDYFDIAVIAFQSLFCLASIHFLFKKITSLLQLNSIVKYTIIIVLCFPLFEPLSIANNICPEGISYPLYLLFVAFNLEFLFQENSSVLKYIVLCFLALAFTRGQFIFSGLIFAFVYLIKYKNQLFKAGKFSKLLLLVFMPILVVLGEMSYHKLKDGILMTTPFGFVNLSSAAYYVSSKEDAQYIVNTDYKTIFEKSYDELKRKQLLMSSQPESTYKNYYAFFHNHIPQICNQTTFATSQDYFLEQHPNLPIASSYYNAEKASKAIALTLIKQNFKQWMQLFIANISYSFYSVVVLFFIIGAFIFSLIKMVFSFHKRYALLFIFSALTISNSVLIAIASHSIMRYTFYNFIFILLTIFMVYKILRHGIKD
jgi:O-antigen ligase